MHILPNFREGMGLQVDTAHCLDIVISIMKGRLDIIGKKANEVLGTGGRLINGRFFFMFNEIVRAEPNYC